MRIIIKKNRLELADPDGVEIDDLLYHIDIKAAISYYGITELLDTIGNYNILSHLEMEQETEQCYNEKVMK